MTIQETKARERSRFLGPEYWGTTAHPNVRGMHLHNKVPVRIELSQENSWLSFTKTLFASGDRLKGKGVFFAKCLYEIMVLLGHLQEVRGTGKRYVVTEPLLEERAGFL